jgi:phosphonoacetaldehyde hydrolase
MGSVRSIQLVVFDWAGTTIDFGCFGPVESFTEALQRHGVYPTDSQVREPMGIAKKDHLRALLTLPELAEQWLAKHGRPWNESDVERIYQDDYIPLQLQAIGENDRLVPGLLDVVEQLRGRGIKVATTTGYFREAAEVIFESALEQGYERDLDVLPDQVLEGRPAPWMILHAMEALGISEPSSVVKVGDTMADIAEGRNARVWSVGVIASSSEVGLSEGEWNVLPEAARKAISKSVRLKFERAGSHRTIETLAELPRLISELEAGGQGPTP